MRCYNFFSDAQGLKSREEAIVLADPVDKCGRCSWCKDVGVTPRICNAIEFDVQDIRIPIFPHSMGVLAKQLPVGWL